jgi:hypothetical protein
MEDGMTPKRSYPPAKRADVVDDYPGTRDHGPDSIMNSTDQEETR